MKPTAFHEQLRERLERFSSQVLWRIVVAGRTIELTGAAILERAEALTNRYCSAPERGVVLLLLPHCEELFLLHIGLILSNRVPAILAWPTSRVDPEKYQRNLLHQLRELPASQVITLPRLAQSLRPALPYAATDCDVEGAAALEKSFVQIDVGSVTQLEYRPQLAPHDTVFLQFSGGTTGAQKAIVVSDSMLQTQLECLAEALAFTNQDAIVSWLPLYHDMGLIACLWFPLWHGAASLQFSAADWLLNPATLFQYMEQFGGTFCWLPNFAFSYLAANSERITGSYKLQNVRGWISCSEPVRQTSIGQFLNQFAEWGVSASSVQASYAMAENVFAVTQTPLGVPPGTLSRSSVQSLRGGLSMLAYDLIDEVYVSSGKAIRGVELRILDSEGQCKEGQPGDIEIRTESLFSGYWGSKGFLTESISADGWYATGDYGILQDGDLYVIGRKKDILIVGGQNIFPEDVEAVVNTVDGIYPGRVVAFGVDDEQLGTETLAIVGELRGEYDRLKAQLLQRTIQKLVLSTVGIAPRYCFVVPERWIVKSTAGKISRKETRARFLQERETLIRGHKL